MIDWFVNDILWEGGGGGGTEIVVVFLGTGKKLMQFASMTLTVYLEVLTHPVKNGGATDISS